MDLLTLLSSNMTVLLIWTCVISLLVGSFLNVVIYRLPIMMIEENKQYCKEMLAEDEDNKTTGQPNQPSDNAAIDNDINNKDSNNDIGASKKFNLAFPNSHCPTCKAAIKWWHNIPLVSYILLRGKCHACRSKISFRYPFIELLTALLSMLVVYHFGFSWQAASGITFTWALIAAVWIDFDHQLLPDSITLGLLWLGLILSLFNIFVDTNTAIISAVAGYGFFWVVTMAFYLLTKKIGMGQGDFKLLAALGVWCGWTQLPLIVLFSSLLAAIVGITLIVTGQQTRHKPIPFGPYLAAAGWIALMWGGPIVNAYIQWLS